MTNEELAEIEKIWPMTTDPGYAIYKLIAEIRRLKLGPSEEEIDRAVDRRFEDAYGLPEVVTSQRISFRMGVAWRSSWSELTKEKKMPPHNGERTIPQKESPRQDQGSKKGREEVKKFERGDSVVFKCLNPATGFIKRVSKDESWADVEWNYALGCSGTTRVKTKNIVRLNPILNRIANDPTMKVWLPEAFQ